MGREGRRTRSQHFRVMSLDQLGPCLRLLELQRLADQRLQRILPEQLHGQVHPAGMHTPGLVYEQKTRRTVVAHFTVNHEGNLYFMNTPCCRTGLKSTTFHGFSKRSSST